MDSENSYSGESSSSSETSSGSSDADEEMMEPVRILGHTMELPQELCEDYSVFKEFFSIKTWEALEEKHREQLTKFLPKFTENEGEELEKTIKMLFEHEPFHFSSPLAEFYNNLRHGNYRPDIAKMRKFLMKARVKQQRHKIKSYYAKLLPEVLISRERLLAAVKGAPPGPATRLPPLPPKRSSKNNYKPLYLRAKQRYFEELAAIQSEVGGEESEDENYPDGPPEQFTKKKKPVDSVENSENNISGTLSGPNQPVQTPLQCLKNILIAHRARRQYRENHPELNTCGITLEDIKQRVALLNGSKKFMFGSQKLGVSIQKLKRNTRKDANFKQSKPYDKPLKKTKDDCHDTIENKQQFPNVKIKCEPDETDSESSSFVDPVMSPKQTKKMIDHDIIQDSPDVKYNITRTSYNDSQMDIAIKQDMSDASYQNTSRISQPVPIKLEDLDGIDMMALPVELADDSGEVIQVETSTETMDESIVDPDESLTETTHANFLSLVRALFPARVAHRATKQQLHARCAAVMKSPIAPLNMWYNLSDDWCAELDSALDFLAGERGTHPEDFVPYLQYIPETQTYQWIGAGRDCDAILGRICERWLRAVSPAQPTSEAPPPRYPTTWTMRAPTISEIAEFRAQERKRFSTAAKPFTYIQHGYRSVVGPCGRAWGGWGGGTGSALVAAGRPRHATFAALLRDALARLPNGRGTRHDVLTLLKMSQWIAPCSDQALLSAVSSALDKFHSAKRDPIVKYDQRTALWTYLHRNRSEEDWVKVTSKGRGKGATAVPPPASSALPLAPQTTLGPASSPTPVPNTATATAGASLSVSTRELPSLSPPHADDLEVGTVEEIIDASDSDVDVDDTNASSSEPQLSFAQLLMQATQHMKQPQVTPSNKPKGKLVAAPASKPKTATITKQLTQSAKQGTSSKQTTLMSQSVKQANLIAQSIKQATVMTQAKGPVTVKTLPQSVKSNTPQTPKTSNSPKQTIVTPLPKQIATQTKPGNVPKTSKQSNLSQSAKGVVSQSLMSLNISSQISSPNATQLSKSLPSLVTPPQKSPLIKQRPLQKTETTQVPVSVTGQTSQTITMIQPSTTTAVIQNPSKVPQGTRSLLIKPPTVQTTMTAAGTPTTQHAAVSRRGVVRVLSPATPSSGKSLISPRALLQTGIATTKKRTTAPVRASVVSLAQSTGSVTTVVSSVPTVVTSSLSTRTVQLAGGRTVQLAANQTVHLPGGQAVQLTPGHTLQLSSLQLPTHSVRLPSGQTVQLASSQAIQAVKMSTANVKNPNPRGQQSSPTVKTQIGHSTVQIPVSTVQLSGQTVQIGGQTVQLTGQSVQLTGHTVKLPSGQSVQVASQSVIPSQSVQLPSGQTVQLASGNVQTMQLSGANVQLPGQSMQVASGQSVQLGSQTVQLSGQTVQLAGGQTVQLPSGQTLQLSSGQTVQLSSGQTLQLANGQTLHLGNQPKTITQVVRSQSSGEKPTTSQPIVAKLLTNAQGQMISLEGMVSSSRGVQVSGVSGVVPRAGLRVLSPATRLARPLLLTSAKPLHNIILQQSDGSAIRVTSSGVSTSSQTLVLSNIGAQTSTTTTSSAPVLKLQQVNALQQVKLAQGIKIQQAGASTTVPTSSGVRSVLMDGQQLKLVGGRHVLARILRPAHPPP